MEIRWVIGERLFLFCYSHDNEIYLEYSILHSLIGFLQMMQQLYKECNLVHADLSEYNMLWHDGKVSFLMWEGQVLSDVKSYYYMNCCLSVSTGLAY